MVTLENDFLKVNIQSAGAEMTSVYYKPTQTEHLWSGDPAIWKFHAPNLFPVVGGCIDGKIRVNGSEYPMPRHGFARESAFRRIEASTTHAKFSLHFSAQTLQVYPYKFEFQVLVDLFGPKIRISYKVINLDDHPLWFSVGGHPAFRVPFGDNGTFEDYYLEFEQAEELLAHGLSSDGFFDDSTRPIPLTGNRLPLSRELFAQDALVFKNIRSKKVTLRGPSPQSVAVSYPHFNYLGLWSKNDAPFVCIEPWIGCADTQNTFPDIREKEGIQRVDHGHVFEAEYFIEIAES